MKVVALAGGVGGARLAHGLSMTGVDLTVVVNTGDDFTHLGLKICPDIDTVTYTLAGLANREQGWGVAGETNAFMAQLRRLGGEDWFLLGDRDLALHVLRTSRLESGEALSTITMDIARRLGVSARILPMTDEPVATVILSPRGELAFQDWFVRLRTDVDVSGFRFEGIEVARPAPGVTQALAGADVVVLCPSNPYVSLDPILSVPGLRAALPPVPVIAVSPIIGGQAVKGPAARLMRDLGAEVSARGVAEHFQGLLTGMVIDNADAALAERMPLPVKVTQTLMKTDADRESLARACLDLAGLGTWTS
ncbi:MULTISPECIES: 2-phospho-L-lactate transferase [unclassified Chelatococcus]|uniref:2-phospho-L-lactate transferase n=1 Tax=unclassified Chelatococcus TaxID=2638111 RepID=UPI001BD0F13E|nr:MULTISPECIES: 2-phospho-L-lactate transferase [unclassified Chelatococcus]MBS7700251.1 2-phospho-L-lactate transferase [Chelatococcus sp. YT9]MBX3558222.1 2-phospho-L-lactate transferase [Chelatococcus sp.]